MNLTDLEEEIRICKLCRLAESRKNAVPGEGNAHAEIMFIGEAPGRNEDEQGRPFVGSAGKLLDQALANAGIKRDEVYITNIVKCRPPNNRVPLQDEVDACMPYLEKQIKLIEPLVICILGRTAYQTLLKGRSITSNRGKLINYKGRNYFLTIHPAAAIYNPSLKQVLIDDIKRLADIVKELKGKALEGYL
ncbi:MAG: uracil-DNA glycosylase [Candidatus Nitrosocaldaceae archaeon]|nr:MAG: uracil-DNA glycosylase [Candidatus Nitrosocaldaceae archaeon]